MVGMTETIIKQYHQRRDAANEMLTEVLCSAYKDATGEYPKDRLKDKLLEAVTYER